MTQQGEKKSLFDKAIDALTNRDEKEAEAAAQAKAIADMARRESEAHAKMAAEKAAAEKAAVEKAAAEQAAALKAAAEKATAEKLAAEKAAAAAPKKGVVMVKSLHIRKDHSTTSAEVGGLTYGKEVTILETWSDGKNTWGKLGPDQWSAIIYNGETYIKIA